MTRAPVPFGEWDRPRQPWMLSGECRDGHDRTLLLEVATRTLFPTMLVFSLYLLLVGHYSPGGGFSGGLVAGLAFVLRYIAGGGPGLGAVIAVRSPVLIGSGLTIAVLTALAPLLVGAPALSTAYLSVDLPVLGTVSTQTSLLLDTGVYLLIVGAVLDLLRALGAGIERDMRDAGELT
ncbi:MnhB domain-containing protein [Pseudonocardia sp.]|uniref:MnhB domain-containing protein n=1 Tax=Pseudonocardia sp. TaxID=60912 RepID=UPI00261F85CF|nr:MnhB domain-containing protein [Pseudonocardia sp.]